MIVSSEDSPTKRSPNNPIYLPSALDGHCWYPAVQRCGCGLNLRSARLWSDHIANLSPLEEAAAS